MCLRWINNAFGRPQDVKTQGDENDRRRTVRLLETTPTGHSSRWRNPDTGAPYVVTPTRTFDQRGAPCRDYTVDAMVAGRPDKVTGTACRQGDGNWRVQG